MENEELERVLDLKSKVVEKQELIRSINNLEDYKNKQEALKNIYKQTCLERGRLINLLKANMNYINELCDKYDMYINIYTIMNREINENYTSTDMINDLKNSMYKEEYNPFEEKILNIINSNLDNLDKMREELNNLDENNGIRELINLKETYSEELKKHRELLNERYSNEFIHKKATLPTIVTVLPKAVGLACKKVSTCIKEMKEAKTNKAKINKLFKVLGSIGQVVATPVIYAGKFVIDHWYLLLLALLAIPKLFNFPWWPFKGKDKDKDKDKNKGDGEPQPQEQEVPAEEPVLIPEREPEKVPGLLPQPEPQPDPVPVIPVPQPEQNPVPDIAKKPAINYDTDPRFHVQPQPEPNLVPDIPKKPAINYDTDPRFHVQPQPVIAPEPVVVSEPAVVPEKTDTLPPLINEAGNGVSISAEKQEELVNLYNHTMQRINERSNGQIFIRELAEAGSPAADIVVCRTPMEYLIESCKLCDIDVNMYLDANGAINTAGYEFMIMRNFGTVGQDTRAESGIFTPVVFEDPNGQYLPEFQRALGPEAENVYSRFTSVRCFDTVEEFNNALVDSDPKYDLVREEFVHDMNVSEAEEGLHCLGALGLIVAGGAAVEAAGSALVAGGPVLLEGLNQLLNILQSSPVAEPVSNAIQLAR